jgi:hypothetical protein
MGLNMTYSSLVRGRPVVIAWFFRTGQGYGA